jgi:hypothetical protein
VPRQVVPFVQNRLPKPPTPPEPEQVARLLADLDSNKFPARQKAATELEKLGPAIEPAAQGAG